MTHPSIDGYLALAVDADLRPYAYGPYPSEPAAREAATAIGFTDPAIAATTVLPLATVGPADLTVPLTEAARPAPAVILAHLHPPPAAGDTPAVVLLAHPTAEALAAVGVFTTAARARRWCDTAAPLPGVDLHVITLAGATRAHPDHRPDPHTIIVASRHSVRCYGPFTDGLHAAAWAHRHIGGLDPHRHTVTSQPVAQPFDLTGQAPVHRPPALVRPGCHIVVLADADARGAVGFFRDEQAAHAWIDSQRPAIHHATFTVLPVADPDTFPTNGFPAT